LLNITSKENKSKVDDYILQSSKKTERDRISDVKTISGVFTGGYAIHPLTNKKTSYLDFRLCFGKLWNWCCYGSPLW
jgi:leucyl-tRNA synthetase